MLVAMPFYVGLAVTAGPLVATVLGPKWVEAAPLVRLLAVAMPAMTLQVLFSPACSAMGRPGINVHTGMIGAVLLPLAFVVGLRWGVTGLAASWFFAYIALSRDHRVARAAGARPVGSGAGEGDRPTVTPRSRWVRWSSLLDTILPRDGGAARALLILVAFRRRRLSRLAAAVREGHVARGDLDGARQALSARGRAARLCPPAPPDNPGAGSNEVNVQPGPPRSAARARRAPPTR